RGPGWQLECLREHAAGLSTGCEQVLVAIASAAPAAAAAPAPSPPPAPPAAPAPAAPAPAAAPPPAPAQRVRPSREQIIALFQSGRRAMREYCYGPGGPGSRIRCLRDNAANVSPGCQQALAGLASGAPGETGAGAAAPPPAIERPARPVSPREVFFLIRTA